MNFDTELVIMIGGIAIGWLLLAVSIVAILSKLVTNAKARDKEFFK